jgi:hypothetical protein
MSKWLLTAGLLLQTMAASADEPALAKSTFIHALDNPAGQLDRRHFAYVPAGTRMVLFPRSVQHNGSERRLVLTEDGQWGFIKSDLYWSGDQLAYFRRENLNVFIQRNYSVLAEVSDALAFRIRLTRGETHHLDSQDDEHYRVAISEQKELGIPAKLVPVVKLPRAQATLVDFDRLDGMRAEDFHGFRRSVFDGIAGLRKRCNTETTSATKIGGSASAGFSLSAFFESLSVEASVEASSESESLERFARDVNVTRDFYTRNGQVGLYKITRIKGCDGGNQQLSFIYTDPNNEEITIDREWAEAQQLPTDGNTGQVLVTCPEQYFAYRDQLVAHNLPAEDVPFVISHTAKFKKLTDSDCQLR